MDQPRFKLWDNVIGLWITSDFAFYLDISVEIVGPNMSQGFIEPKIEFLNEVEIVWPDKDGNFIEPEM